MKPIFVNLLALDAGGIVAALILPVRPTTRAILLCGWGGLLLLVLIVYFLFGREKEAS